MATSNKGFSRFLLEWVLSNSVIVSIAMGLSWSTFVYPAGWLYNYFDCESTERLQLFASSFSNPSCAEFLMSGIVISYSIVVGICIGIFQWLVLFYYLRIDLRWIFYNLIGWLISSLICLCYLYLLYQHYLGSVIESITAYIALFSGLPVLSQIFSGVLHRSLLKPSDTGRWWWVVFNTVGWLFAGFSFIVLERFMNFVFQVASFDSTFLSFFYLGLLMGLVGGAFSGIGFSLQSAFTSV
ncbi:MAG: hypothetical protein U0175_34620 [Caldilineaceae bacterium]